MRVESINTYKKENSQWFQIVIQTITYQSRKRSAHISFCLSIRRSDFVSMCHIGIWYSLCTTLYPCHTSGVKIPVLKGPTALVLFAGVTRRVKLPLHTCPFSHREFAERPAALKKLYRHQSTTWKIVEGRLPCISLLDILISVEMAWRWCHLGTLRRCAKDCASSMSPSWLGPYWMGAGKLIGLGKILHCVGNTPNTFSTCLVH